MRSAVLGFSSLHMRIRVKSGEKQLCQLLAQNRGLPAQLLPSPKANMEEQIWCFPSFVSPRNWPVFRIEVPPQKNGTEIAISVGQSDKRLGGYLSSDDPHLPIFLKVMEEMGNGPMFGGGKPTLQSSSSNTIDVALVTVSGWAHCRDAVSVVKVRGNKSEKSDGQREQKPTVLYLSVAVCGTETTDAAFRLVAR